MRHIKLVIFLVILAAGAGILLKITANDPSVRGQDPNVETRGTNTAGAPLVGTSGATDPAAGSTAGHDGRSGPRPGEAWRGDGGFVSDAAEMNAAEVALSSLAERRATSADVKTFAAELQRDHTAAGTALKTLAARKQWPYPGTVDALHAQALQALDRAQSAEFDRAFIDAMVASHEKAIASFRLAAASAADPELKAWAAGQVPGLERHLAHARRLQ